LAHTTNLLVLALDKVFGELADYGLLDLRIWIRAITICGEYEKVCVNNLRILQELMETFREKCWHFKEISMSRVKKYF